jgi:cytochrome P450
MAATYRVFNDPIDALDSWRKKYGDPLLVPTLNGDMVITGRPELVKQLFALGPDVVGPFGTDVLTPVLGEHSLLTKRGDVHRRKRKLLTPPLHGDRMRTYAELIRRTARAHFDRATAKRSIPFLRLGQRISMDVILRAVFGVAENARLTRLTRLILDVMEGTSPMLLFVPGLRRDFGGIGPYAKQRRKFRALDEALQEQIDRQRARGDGEDILSLLLSARYDDGAAMPDEEVRDELRAMLFAGHESTGISIAWAADATHRHPEVLARARDEIEALGPDADATAWAKLDYVGCIVKETLRLFPVTTEVIRTLDRPITLDGHELPAGGIVAASIAAAHRDESVFPEPKKFRPERFEVRSYGPNEYFPYGGGIRRCLGAAFADFEQRLVLATLVEGYEVELLSDRAPRLVRRNITLAPDDGVPVRIRARGR